MMLGLVIMQGGHNYAGGQSNYEDGSSYPVGQGDGNVHDFFGEMPTATVQEEEQVGIQNSWGGQFVDMVRAADEVLYENCPRDTKLSAVASLMNFKVNTNMSAEDYDEMISIIKRLLPEDNSLPEDYYSCRKLVNELALPMKKIHACRNGCMLFWKEYSHLTECKFCPEPRYKGYTKRGIGIPHSVLRYFPITPRLQRLYASKVTAGHMTWHHDEPAQEGIMTLLEITPFRVGQNPSLIMHNPSLKVFSDGFCP